MAPTRRDRYTFWERWERQVDWEYLSDALYERRLQASVDESLPHPLELTVDDYRYGVLGVFHDSLRNTSPHVSNMRTEWVQATCREYGRVLFEQHLLSEYIATDGSNHESLGQELRDHSANTMLSRDLAQRLPHPIRPPISSRW